jgi:hypothetical protein
MTTFEEELARLNGGLIDAEEDGESPEEIMLSLALATAAAVISISKNLEELAKDGS